jgi:GAF domain-containing protein
LRRVAIRLIDERRGKTVRVASYGPPLTSLPDETSLANSPLSLEASRPPRAVVEELGEREIREGSTLNVNSLLVAPIRLDNHFIGVIVGDRNGEPFGLNQGELDLAQSMANVAALSLSGARTAQAAGVA